MQLARAAPRWLMRREFLVTVKDLTGPLPPLAPRPASPGGASPRPRSRSWSPESHADESGGLAAPPRGSGVLGRLDGRHPRSLAVGNVREDPLPVPPPRRAPSRRRPVDRRRLHASVPAPARSLRGGDGDGHAPRPRAGTPAAHRPHRSLELLVPPHRRGTPALGHRDGGVLDGRTRPPAPRDGAGAAGRAADACSCRWTRTPAPRLRAVDRRVRISRRAHRYGASARRRARRLASARPDDEALAGWLQGDLGHDVDPDLHARTHLSASSARSVVAISGMNRDAGTTRTVSTASAVRSAWYSRTASLRSGTRGPGSRARTAGRTASGWPRPSGPRPSGGSGVRGRTGTAGQPLPHPRSRS